MSKDQNLTKLLSVELQRMLGSKAVTLKENSLTVT